MPLFIACRKGHCDIVECLLRANADVNLQTKVRNNTYTDFYILCAFNTNGLETLTTRTVYNSPSVM